MAWSQIEIDKSLEVTRAAARDEQTENVYNSPKRV